MDIYRMASFSIIVDPARDLIVISGAGFFALDEVADFAKDLRAAHRQLTCPSGYHTTLIDTTQVHIQSQEVVAAFSAIARDPVLRSRRTAYVVGASLARGQAQRLSDPDRTTVGYFSDHAAAEIWLMQGAFTGARTASRYRHARVSPMSDVHDCTDRSAA